MRRDVTGGENPASHSNVGGEVAIGLCEFDRSSNCGQRRDDGKNKVGG
jgi:hypothetical protein